MISSRDMRHYPVYLDLTDRVVAVSGAGETAIPKLRLLMKTAAKIEVYASLISDEIRCMASKGHLTVIERPMEETDAKRFALIYAANENGLENTRIAGIGASTGRLVNVVDNLEESDFITPAIVDRSPVTVAIGTEGSAPVLARGIKAAIESLLPVSIGALAKIGSAFRGEASKLPGGRTRREFWSNFYFREGPRALAEEGPDGAARSLKHLASRISSFAPDPGSVVFAGIGQGNPELLPHKTRRLLHDADAVVYDKNVSNAILELARREATFYATRRHGDGRGRVDFRSIEFMESKAKRGELVVRLFSEISSSQGTLSFEIDAVASRGVQCELIRNKTECSRISIDKTKSRTAMAPISASPTSRSRKSTIPNSERRPNTRRKYRYRMGGKSSYLLSEISKAKP